MWGTFPLPSLTKNNNSNNKKVQFNQDQSFLTIVRHSEIECYAGNCLSYRVSLATQFSGTRYLYLIRNEGPYLFNLLRKLVSLHYYNKSHIRNSTNLNSHSTISSCILNEFESVTPSNKTQGTTLHDQRVKK